MASDQPVSDRFPSPPVEAPNTQVGNRPLDDVLATIERREILAALGLANGQRTLAARLLRISRSRLYRRLEALGIESDPKGEKDQV